MAQAPSSETDEAPRPTARVVWKGAISFGLVHIPVALYTATTSSAVDFDWLDRRTMEPVGYKRINKTTGEDIDSENIVKGVLAVGVGGYLTSTAAGGDYASVTTKAQKFMELARARAVPNA